MQMCVGHSSDLSDASLCDLHLLLELIFEGFRDDCLTVLGNGILELTVNLHHHKFIVTLSLTLELEDASVVLIGEVTVPEATCLRHELILDIQVPVLVVTVELEVLALRHVVDGHDAIILLHWMVLEGQDGVWYHLLEVVNLVDVFSLVPDTVWLVDEDEILVLGVDHLANVVHIHVLEQDEHVHDVGCVCWSCEGTLTSILHVHVFVVITISVRLELPAATVLELFGNTMPVPIFSHPINGRCTIGGIDLKDVETGSETKGAEGQTLPELDPLGDASVLIDDLALREVEGGIWAQRGSLHEWLELITGMSRCSFDTENTLDRLFSEDWVSKTGGDVGELLIITPFNFPFVSLIVIVVASGCSALERLLEVDLLGLREPGAGGLSPSVVEIEVDVVKVIVAGLAVGNLIMLGRDIALVDKILRSDLGDVHINKVSVVAVDLHHLIFVVAVNIDVVIGANVLVRQDDSWLSELVAGGVHVAQMEVALFLVLVDLEEEVLFSDDLVIGALSKLLSRYLVLELNETNFLLDNLVDSLADIGEVLRASSFAKLAVSTWLA